MRKIICAILAVMLVMSMCIIPAMAKEENVALGKRITVTTDVPNAVPVMDGDFWKTSNLTDGQVPIWDGTQTTLGWYCAYPVSYGPTGNTLVILDLDDYYDVSEIKVYPMGFLDGANLPSDFVVYVSDGSEWVAVGAESGLAGANGSIEPFTYTVNRTALQVCVAVTKLSGLVVDANWIYGGFGEIEVYGTKIADGPKQELTPLRFSVDVLGGKQSWVVENNYVTAECMLEKGTAMDIIGWMLSSTTGLDKIQYKIDGGDWKDASNKYRARPDVIDYFVAQTGEQYDASQNSRPGFGLDNDHMLFEDVAGLAVGTYTLKVRAVMQDGTDVEFITANLEIADEIYIPDPTNIPLDETAEIYMFSDSNLPGVPYNFKAAASSGLQFEIPEGKEASQFVILMSPTWGNAGGTGSDVLVSLYNWKGDYASSVTDAELVDTLQIYGHKDCENLVIQFNDRVPAGEYILIFVANGTMDVGLWQAGGPSEYAGSEIYVNDGLVAPWYAYWCAMVHDVDTPVTEGPQAADLHGASFDTLYINDEMNFGEGDGSASTKLDGHDRTVDGSDGSVEKIRVRGWIGFESAIAQFGYKINNNEPVFGDFAIAPEAAVVDPANGGEFASRFDITIPVAELKGTNTIVAVVKLADGTIVEIDENVTANGAGTAPNTQLTYVGPAAPETEPVTETPVTEAPQTGDASVMAIAMIAVIALAAVLVIRRKVTE